ncbi:hypothetical protein BJ508DRAFT_330350 [Ascobolus immersus RN42]|uniref:Uncharacterized protein n=1 Tax=Ascobolus immersus RN42 TaxID=1160509 RepID=A0A3N4HZ85_ASCIM|nr:hypothetical protein BJ508DRAFT_330350 [Ascobolus immersus RN42]
MDHPTSRMKQAFDSFSKRNKDKLGAGAASIPQKGPDKILLDENADPIEVDPDISDRETLAADVDAPMDLSEEWMAAYEIARKQLTKKEYEWLKAAQSKNKSGASLLVETTKLREDAAKKDWTMKWGGKDVVVKDKAAKLLRIIQKHAKVIDIAVGHSPEISSLIWSGLRLLLQLALNGLETLQILEEAMGTVAINMAEAQIYASVYKGALDGVTLEGEYAQATLKENIENALPDFYAAILVFLVKAKYYYKPMGAKGRLKLLLLPASEGLKEQVDGINACLRRLMVLASAATMVRTKDAAAASVDVKHSLGEITHMSTLNVSLNKGLHNAIKDHSNLLQEIIETSTASLEKLTGTYQNVTDLLKLLEDGSAAMMVELQALSLRAGYTSRLIASISFETADIKETVRDLHTTTNETSERVEDISQDTGEIKQTTKSAEQAMKEVKGLLLREQEERFKQQTANIRKNLLAALAPHIAESASFNSRFWEHKDKCLEGTREVILKDIWDWSQTADPGKSVYWLAGMAGTGKSTIALTAATEFKNQGRLGASFFFSRQHAELGNSSRFVATVCVMLLLGFPEVAMVLKTVFENDPQICSRGFREQWRQLVVLPLQQLYAIGPLKSPIIIVIDALDECEDEQGVKYILEALSQITSVGEFGLRVLLTSRPEHAINSGIREYLSSLHQFFALHDIERQIVDNDIKIYLTNELEKICCEGGIPRSQWPGQQDIDSLLRNSEQLFLYASTVCIFLRQMIRQLGGITHALRVIVSDFRGMDALYGGVLAHALQEYKAPALEAFRDDLEHNLKRIVGGIVTMLKPLSPKSLAELLDIQAFFDIRLALMNLSSIVQISQRDSDDDDDGCIRLLHLSFREFVLDEDRCRRDTFGVDERLAHGSLAEQCLTYMSKFLKEDMCGLGVPGFYRKDIEEQTIAGTFSPTFRYAVSYWGQHLQRSHMQLEDNDQTHTFLRAHYIHLVEAVTLLDLYPQTIRLFRELAERFVVQDRHDNSEFYKLLRNAEIFMWKHQAEIREAPLQIYSYAIAFSPTCFTDTFPASLPPWLQTPQPHGKYHMPRDWSPELLRFKFSIPPRPMEYDENDIPGRENYTVGFFMTDLVGVSQLFGAAPSRKGPHYPLLWSYTTGSQFKQQEVTDFIHNFYFGQHVENSFWSFQDSVRLWCSGSLVVAMSHPRTSGIVQIDIWEAADISNYTHTSTPVATITLPINTINRDIFFGYNPEGNTCTQPGSRVVFSPDGNSIAIVVPKNMGGFHLWCKKYQNGLIRIPDGTLGVRPRFGNILQVVLSSEGDTVLILMLAPDAVAFEIHLIDTTTGLLRSRIHVPESNVRAKLTVGARKRMGCAISPDCSSIFLAAAGNPSIASSHILWRLESDGSSYSAQFLDWNSEENLKDAECPVFSANGKLLAVACRLDNYCGTRA